MKIISLNTWGGRAFAALEQFIRTYRDDVDIFCLQEMFDGESHVLYQRHPDAHISPQLFGEIGRELHGHAGWFATHEDRNIMSNAMFVRKELGGTVDDVLVYEPKEPVLTGSAIVAPRRVQRLRLPGGLAVFNYHGAWWPNDDKKGDSPDRLAQVRNLLDVVDAWSGPKVLMGDFNFHPNTRSWHMLFDAFGDERVMNGCWRTTRTPLYRHYDRWWPQIIDYCFVNNVQVRAFRLLPEIVSDHLALCLDIE